MQIAEQVVARSTAARAADLSSGCCARVYGARTARVLRSPTEAACSMRSAPWSVHVDVPGQRHFLMIEMQVNARPVVGGAQRGTANPFGQMGQHDLAMAPHNGIQRIHIARAADELL